MYRSGESDWGGSATDLTELKRTNPALYIEYLESRVAREASERERAECLHDTLASELGTHAQALASAEARARQLDSQRTALATANERLRRRVAEQRDFIDSSLSGPSAAPSYPQLNYGHRADASGAVPYPTYAQPPQQQPQRRSADDVVSVAPPPGTPSPPLPAADAAAAEGHYYQTAPGAGAVFPPAFTLALRQERHRFAGAGPGAGAGAAAERAVQPRPYAAAAGAETEVAAAAAAAAAGTSMGAGAGGSRFASALSGMRARPQNRLSSPLDFDGWLVPAGAPTPAPASVTAATAAADGARRRRRSRSRSRSRSREHNRGHTQGDGAAGAGADADLAAAVAAAADSRALARLLSTAMFAPGGHLQRARASPLDALTGGPGYGGCKDAGVAGDGAVAEVDYYPGGLTFARPGGPTFTEEWGWSRRGSRDQSSGAEGDGVGAAPPLPAAALALAMQAAAEADAEAEMEAEARAHGHCAALTQQQQQQQLARGRTGASDGGSSSIATGRFSHSAFAGDFADFAHLADASAAHMRRGFRAGPGAEATAHSAAAAAAAAAVAAAAGYRVAAAAAVADDNGDDDDDDDEEEEEDEVNGDEDDEDANDNDDDGGLYFDPSSGLYLSSGLASTAHARGRARARAALPFADEETDAVADLYSHPATLARPLARPATRLPARAAARAAPGLASSAATAAIAEADESTRSLLAELYAVDALADPAAALLGAPRTGNVAAAAAAAAAKRNRRRLQRPTQQYTSTSTGTSTGTRASASAASTAASAAVPVTGSAAAGGSGAGARVRDVFRVAPPPQQQEEPHHPHQFGARGGRGAPAAAGTGTGSDGGWGARLSSYIPFGPTGARAGTGASASRGRNSGSVDEPSLPAGLSLAAAQDFERQFLTSFYDEFERGSLQRREASDAAFVAHLQTLEEPIRRRGMQGRQREIIRYFVALHREKQLIAEGRHRNEELYRALSRIAGTGAADSAGVGAGALGSAAERAAAAAWVLARRPAFVEDDETSVRVVRVAGNHPLTHITADTPVAKVYTIPSSRDKELPPEVAAARFVPVDAPDLAPRQQQQQQQQRAAGEKGAYIDPFDTVAAPARVGARPAQQQRQQLVPPPGRGPYLPAQSIPGVRLLDQALRGAHDLSYAAAERAAAAVAGAGPSPSAGGASGGRLAGRAAAPAPSAGRRSPPSGPIATATPVFEMVDTVDPRTGKRGLQLVCQTTGPGAGASAGRQAASRGGATVGRPTASAASAAAAAAAAAAGALDPLSRASLAPTAVAGGAERPLLMEIKVNRSAPPAPTAAAPVPVPLVAPLVDPREAMRQQLEDAERMRLVQREVAKMGAMERAKYLVRGVAKTISSKMSERGD